MAMAGFVQSTTGAGFRSSAATAYLNPIENQPQIDILINTRVAKLFPTSNSGTPHFNVVAMQQVSGGVLTIHILRFCGF